MGPSKKCLTLVESGQFFLACVGFGFGKSPLKFPNVSIFSHRIKKNLFVLGQKVSGSENGLGSNLLQVKVCSDRVRAHIYLPQDCTMNEKSLATEGGICKAKVMTGKATAPPPSDVAPPIKDPNAIVMDIG